MLGREEQRHSQGRRVASAWVGMDLGGPQAIVLACGCGVGLGKRGWFHCFCGDRRTPPPWRHHTHPVLTSPQCTGTGVTPLAERGWPPSKVRTSQPELVCPSHRHLALAGPFFSCFSQWHGGGTGQPWPLGPPLLESQWSAAQQVRGPSLAWPVPPGT